MNPAPPENLPSGTDAADHALLLLASEEAATTPAPHSKRVGYWQRMGGGSLMISLFVHAAVVVLAVFWIIKTAFIAPPPPPQEFLSGGGGGQHGATPQEKRQQTRAMQLTPPAMRLASSVSSDNPVTLQNVNSTMSAYALAIGGQMGAASSGSGSGAGGGIGSGFGKGIGPGFGPGSGAGFVAMFGKKIQARKLAVVLDVSGSMHRFLPAVVKEANKVSGGCPIVLYYGCGLMETKDRSIERQDAEPCRGRDFDAFWRRNFNQPGMAPAKDGPVPNEEVFKVFNDRKDTWYFDRVNISYAWLALTSPKVRGADAIYWFADFQDPVDDKQLLDLQKTLKNRKQKLYVHASGRTNPSLAAVTQMLVEPTGGEVLKVEIETTTPTNPKN